MTLGRRQQLFSNLSFNISSRYFKTVALRKSPNENDQDSDYFGRYSKEKDIEKGIQDTSKRSRQKNWLRV
jgi:hypothetical protein